MRIPVRRAPVILTVLVVSAVSSASALRAQSVDPSVRRAVSSLGDSAVVRVIAPGVFVDPGRFLGLAGDSIRLADADVRLSVAFDELEELAVQKRQWIKVGATAAGVAAVFGGAIGFFLGTGDCDFQLSGCGRHQVNGIVEYGGWGMLVGGVVGAVIGSQRTEWRTVFP